MFARLRGAIGNLLLAVAALLTVAGLVELALRLAPDALLPPGSYGAGRRSDELGFNVHGSRVLYTKAGSLVVREPNADGFLDRAHVRGEAREAFRIGVFGDSYVESAQVPLDVVFYRQLEERLRARGVETLGFGVSGWGTVHALRAFETFAPLYRIDLALYVFVENDLGDQSFELASAQGIGSNMPFAEPVDEEPGYRLRWTVEPEFEPWWFRPAKWLQRHSLLAHLVRDRLVVLRQVGVRVRADAGDREMAQRASGTPGANDLPGSWPTPTRERALALGERVLADFERATHRAGARLVVLYVPRGEAQLRGEIRREDTWLPWLEQVTAQLGIPLLDPSDAFRAGLARGEPMYSDHWTPAGHAVLADFLAERLAPYLPESRSARPRGALR